MSWRTANKSQINWIQNCKSGSSARSLFLTTRVNLIQNSKSDVILTTAFVLTSKLLV
jgi:hypothetical protein